MLCACGAMPVSHTQVYHPIKLPVLSRVCLERRIAMVVVGFPATALLLTRARVCISASHTPEDLDYALAVLDEVRARTRIHTHT